MLNYKEAKDLLIQHVSNTGVETIQLSDAEGRITAEDILSPVSHPLFDQSAVDGYAFHFGSYTRLAHNDDNHNDDKIRLQVKGEVKAGDPGEVQLNAGETLRIFTGARVPNGIDTVVMQEQVTADGSEIVLGKEVKQGQHVRKAAEQIKEGELAIKRGSSINPATIGFLASLGIIEVEVAKPPIVKIIVTGDEFASDTDGLATGKIFESNGEMLVAALNKMCIQSSFEECTDSLELLTEKVKVASEASDVLLVSGGVSVGDYDFTKPALEANGYEEIFHKVKQKPGKPLLFMKKGDKVVFGLPGNPRAVMICYYLYVLPMLNAMMGRSSPYLTQAAFKSASAYKKKDDDRTHFLAGKINGKEVEFLEVQGSHMMKSLTEADCIIVNPKETLEINRGDLVNVSILP
ncbi:MAG TPA: molybdopterin molybdotransferase MoeA [Flavobacteriales bacterium]|nr:molybdopterin molybdotransferase MoeA [Flavobacteriales bacterium]